MTKDSFKVIGNGSGRILEPDVGKKIDRKIKPKFKRGFERGM
jgi:peptide/nickel transport system permease protein